MPDPDAGRDLGQVLAVAVRARRRDLGLRQGDLAARMGWPVDRVTRVEAGINRPLLADLPDLCAALGCTLTDLLAAADPAMLRVLGLTPGLRVVLDDSVGSVGGHG